MEYHAGRSLLVQALVVKIKRNYGAADKKLTGGMQFDLHPRRGRRNIVQVSDQS